MCGKKREEGKLYCKHMSRNIFFRPHWHSNVETTARCDLHDWWRRSCRTTDIDHNKTAKMSVFHANKKDLNYKSYKWWINCNFKACTDVAKVYPGGPYAPSHFSFGIFDAKFASKLLKFTFSMWNFLWKYLQFRFKKLKSIDLLR